MAERTLHKTCVVCPRGCPLTIEIDHGRVTVDGNECPKGDDYGLEEATAPRRFLTTTVQTTLSGRPRLPVRTAKTVLLAEVTALMGEIDSVVVNPPVRCGDTIATDLCGTGAVLVATDDLIQEE